MKGCRITISFPQHKEDIYHALLSQPNRSQYVLDAVEEKLINEKGSSFESKVLAVIDKHYSGEKLSFQNKEAKPPLEKVVSEKTKDLINDLF